MKFEQNVVGLQLNLGYWLVCCRIYSNKIIFMVFFSLSANFNSCMLGTTNICIGLPIPCWFLGLPIACGFLIVTVCLSLKWSNDYMHVCRREFEHLSKLLWSRTVGSSSLKPEDGSIRKMPISEQENGSRRPSLPVDFSIRTYSVAVSTYNCGN